MCECMCSSIKGDIAFQTGESYVCIDAYMGCAECADVIGIDVSVFTKEGAAQFMGGLDVPIIAPDEYGGPNGQKAACFEMFSIADLAEAATLLGLAVDPDYENWRDYMDDYGLKWMQAAQRLCAERTKQKEQYKHEGR